MKIKSILVAAEKCTTQKDADNLLQMLKDAFGAAKYLSNLPIHNDESYMEGKEPFVSFELNREISEHYVTMIKPEIRNGELVVVVATNFMNDGLGMRSRDWEIAPGLDQEVIETCPEQTVAQVAKQAVELAIADHRFLLERLGLPEKVAQTAAKKSW